MQMWPCVSNRSFASMSEEKEMENKQKRKRVHIDVKWMCVLHLTYLRHVRLSVTTHFTQTGSVGSDQIR